jgi:hypothetical protein
MDIDSTLLLYLLYPETKQRLVLERNSIVDRGSVANSNVSSPRVKKKVKEGQGQPGMEVW